MDTVMFANAMAGIVLAILPALMPMSKKASDRIGDAVAILMTAGWALAIVNFAVQQ